MRLFLFIIITVLILLFLFVIYCLLRVGAEEDRWVEEHMRGAEKEEK